MVIILISAVGFLFLSGCTNLYAVHYQDFTESRDILAYESVLVSPEQPRLEYGTDIGSDSVNMMKKGYLCIGVSHFNVANVNQNDALLQAKNVHAETVIVYKQYTDTRSGVMSYSTPSTQTSYHSGNVSGGGVSGYYSGTSTSYGRTTKNIPYSIKRYDFYASYWVKIKPKLGVYLQELTDEMKRQIGSNKGAYVWIVINESPAYENDILPKDIIRRINGIEVVDQLQANEITSGILNSEIELEIFRDGKTITKKIKLNPDGQ